jgi:NADP-dependent 3-hydroxy acid dehydrogenase YdfG
MFSVVDVRDGESVNVWISATVSRFGKHDGAVHMAGVITKSREMEELSDEEWDSSFLVMRRGFLIVWGWS